MPYDRRLFLTTAVISAIAVALPGTSRSQSTLTENAAMHGLIGRMMAAPGQRDALIAILLDGIHNMPGCLSYIVARDTSDENAIWITEVWDSEASHKASLSLPTVQAAIAKAKPLIAGFGDYIQTAPVGGHGLAK
ncbi:antibiotic biosynthesis monooxygenase [Lysobacter auxotrophicus]|uniref:Antibiotic biosynthesis monooxygenase n=2 Tax=Lysobacter auxotrophicus TaxID=2992573 RepID=A0ABM8DHA7_9GAMM|nr:antibiotic biosynthesis monooxygenase [Lysobacter auxotrophicus]